MSTYHVDSEHILNASTQVNSSIESIRSSVSTMCAQAAQRTMEESLVSIQQAMTHAAQLYADTEAQASQLFAQ